MTISYNELEKRQEILINKVIELFQQNLDLFQNLSFFVRNYGKIDPIIRNQNLIIVTEFIEGKILKDFLTKQEEWHKIFSWRTITECALKKLGIQ